METIESLHEKLGVLTTPGHRGKVLARGLARGMIWRDGQLPPESPNFSNQLTLDLLDHGYRILDAAISLLEMSGESTEVTDRCLRIAGEAIESAVRRGERSDPGRGFHLVCAATAFHIAHYSARSFCLLRGEIQDLNLSSSERVLCLLMRRELTALTTECIRWLEEPEHLDERIADRLEAEDDDFHPHDALYLALSRNFHRAIASFEFGLRHGIAGSVQDANERLTEGLRASAETGHVPMWWLTRLARHLLSDLWAQSYHVRLPTLPPDVNDTWNALRRQFIALLACRDLANVDFWPSQIAAADRVVNTADDLVAALPTSSGKTRIAELCVLRCLADELRVVYVTPLRSLSAQVEATLAATFRPLGFSTSAVYGASGIAAADVETLRSGSIVVATPEKLDFAIRQDPDVIADVGLIVLDEGHMIGLGEREIRYEALVQRLLRRDDAGRRRIVCLSAIFSPGPSFDAFTDWIRSGEPGEAIRSKWRPTRQRKGELIWRKTAARLDYAVEGETVFVPRFIEAVPGTGRRRNPFPNDKNELIVAATAKFSEEGRSVLIYCPIRKSVETLAEQFLKSHGQGYFTSHRPAHQSNAIDDAVRVGREWLGAAHPAVKALEIGIAVHHGQLPRAFLREIENLLKERVLTIAISSPTLAQGVDLSFEVLIFSSLWRNQRRIEPTEFANVIGRVGRAHVDLDGIYVLPVFEASSSRINQRIREYRELDAQAKQRQMESGILLLIHFLLDSLAKRLQVSRDQVAEYVLNNQATWTTILTGESDQIAFLTAATNELDNAIFSTILDLDCSAESVADRLDEALRDSYWQRRLATRNVKEQASQVAVLRSRAIWLWNATTSPQRRGFFSAGIGHFAGEAIAGNADAFGQILLDGETAVLSGHAEAAAKAAIGIGAELFNVHPFACKRPARWEQILIGWLNGAPTSSFADADEIAFIQDGIVYRLVWAVESVRTTLSALGTLPDGAESGNFALCLTYGVPTVPAALILQTGLSSRTLAIELVRQLNLSFTDKPSLTDWLDQVSAGAIQPSLSPDDDREWTRFVSELRHAARGKWFDAQGTYPVEWLEDIPPEGTILRVQNAPNGREIELRSPDLDFLGKINEMRLNEGGCSLGTVNAAQSLDVTRYGPRND